MKDQKFTYHQKKKQHDQSCSAEDRYKPSNQIRFKTSVLRSDLCDFIDAYILVEETITVLGTSNMSRKNWPLAFKDNAPFITCISKINNTLVDNAKDLDVVMPIYNLTESSKNDRKTTVGLWNYYRDELNDDTNDNNIPNKNVTNPKSFKYKTSVTGSTIMLMQKLPMQKAMKLITLHIMQKKSGKKEVEIAVPLKYLSNFWRAWEMPLINCEVSLILTWSRECIITSTERRAITNTQRDVSPTNATFKITNTKLYVLVATL